MVHLGDEAQVVAHFSPFGDSVSLMQDRCMVCAKLPSAQKLFWTHSMVLLGDVGQVEAHFGPFRDSVILTQVRSTVCTKRTISSDMI